MKNTRQAVITRHLLHKETFVLSNDLILLGHLQASYIWLQLCTSPSPVCYSPFFSWSLPFSPINLLSLRHSPGAWWLDHSFARCPRCTVSTTRAGVRVRWASLETAKRGTARKTFDHLFSFAVSRLTPVKTFTIFPSAWFAWITSFFCRLSSFVSPPTAFSPEITSILRATYCLLSPFSLN